MTVDTETLLESITHNLKSSADWRREKAVEYPDDRRNHVAAEALDNLAAAFERRELSPALLQECAHLCSNEYAGEKIAEWEDLVRRQIGFYGTYSPDEYLGSMIDVGREHAEAA
jgi:hypothetical protein